MIPNTVLLVLPLLLDSFYSPNQRGAKGGAGTSKSTSIQTDGNTLYDLHLPESLGRLANKCKYLHIFGNPLQKPPLAVAEQGILHAIAKYLKEIKD